MKNALTIACLVALFFFGCKPKNAQNKEKKPVSNIENIDSDLIYPKFFVEDNQKELFQKAILQKVETGKLKAYKDETFTELWDYETFIKEANKIDTIQDFDETTGEMITTYIPHSFSWKDIVAYKFASKLVTQNGKLNFKNEAIAPMIDIFSDGTPIGQSVLFWVKMDKVSF